MSAHTEERIRQLCRDAAAAKTDAEAEDIVPELRSTLHEHIRLAKESLTQQASTISFLESQSAVRKSAA